LFVKIGIFEVISKIRFQRLWRRL